MASELRTPVIYLDSSALVKLVLTEPESPALRAYLAERADLPMASSIVHRAEISRAVWQASPEQLPRSYRQMRGVEAIALSRPIAEAAGTLAPRGLPPLLAIHLASALALREYLTAFVAYDDRQIAAARGLRLPVLSPA